MGWGTWIFFGSWRTMTKEFENHWCTVTCSLCKMVRRSVLIRVYVFFRFVHVHLFSVFEFTCEKELLYAARAAPPWCAPPLRPNGAVSGLARHLHSADESLWWFPIAADMCWSAHTFKKRAMRAFGQLCHFQCKVDIIWDVFHGSLTFFKPIMPLLWQHDIKIKEMVSFDLW